jgi:hypothetical protein
VRLFRVLPYDVNAAPDERGGVFYRSGTSAGRVANPDLYRELYLGRAREGAIAESLGRLPIWHPSDFVHASGHRMALAEYELPDAVRIFDLDDVDALRSIGILRPGEIVTRDRAKTRAWARAIFERSSEYAGAAWWSSYNPDWTSIGLWDISDLQLVSVPEPLGTEHPIVRSAAATIVRQIVASP